MRPVRLIHRFWMGREMPAAYQYFGTQWARLNPTWSVFDWDESVLSELFGVKRVIADLRRRDDGRNGIELAVQIADVVGYALVERMGGAYFNCDMEPVRPLPEMPNQAWASLENNDDGRIVNAAIGAPTPHDPFWLGVLIDLVPRYFANPTAEMVETTGPALLTDYAHAHPGDLHVFGTNTFNPVHWKQIEPGGDASAWRDSLPPETIAVHHWGHRLDGRSNVVETATQ